ncbi:MAG: hypothetical protein SFU99_09045 [Saprospiraceae bacterium]|nr:hypothetical protein [Saprospiraceae bacterium]
MKKTIILLTFLCFLASLLPVHASTVRGGEQVSINNTVNENLYVAGGNVTINATVNGDIIGAGGEIRINEAVNQDILLTGGELTIRGIVGGDVRVGGGEVTIFANIMGDLVITGGELEVKPGVEIHGDIYIAGGEVKFEGIAKGKMKIVGGEVNFNGVAENELLIKAGEIRFYGEAKSSSQLAAETLILGSDARFHGNVEYWTESKNLDFENHLVDGAKAKYNENLKFKARIEERWVRKGIAGFMAYRLLSAALLISLMVGFFDKFFNKNSGQIQANIGKYISTGITFMIGVPFLSLLAFITVIGIPVGFIMMSSYAIGMTLAGSLTAIVATYELERYLKRDWNKASLIAISVGFFAALKLIGMMAFPGKLIVFVLTAIAIGGVIRWLRQGWRKVDEEPHSEEGASSDSDIV